MDDSERAQVISRIMKSGPDRVLIDEAGEAASPGRAREEYRITPDVVFVRKDGWSLASPLIWAQTAFEMWEYEWDFWMMRPTRDIYSLQQWGIFGEVVEAVARLVGSNPAEAIIELNKQEPFGKALDPVLVRHLRRAIMRQFGGGKGGKAKVPESPDRRRRGSPFRPGTGAEAIRSTEGGDPRRN